MQDMNGHRHLVVDAAVAAVMVVETDEIDPEIADDLEVQEEVDHEADQIGKNLSLDSQNTTVQYFIQLYYI